MILRGTVYSEVLNLETGLSILTPKDYQSEDTYKVAYLLHGISGNHESWLTNTMLPVYANKYNIVFVMPEVNRSFYSDMTYGLNYFTYVSQELPRIINKTFKISAKKEDTLVIGASMGGYGALKCALNYPDVYGYCLAISAVTSFTSQKLTGLKKKVAIENQEGTESQRLLSDLEATFGTDFTPGESDDLLRLAQNIPVNERPKLFMTCGIKDNLLVENQSFQSTMRESGWELTYEEKSGGHTWYFFNDALINGLRWYRNNSK